MPIHAPCLPARHCSTTMPFDSSSCSPWPCCGMVSPPVAAACAVISRSLGCAPPSSATGSARWRQPPGGPAASMTQTVQRLAVATGAAASCSADVQGLARLGAGAGARHQSAGRAATSLCTALSTFHALTRHQNNGPRPTFDDVPSGACLGLLARRVGAFPRRGGSPCSPNEKNQ